MRIVLALIVLLAVSVAQAQEIQVVTEDTAYTYLEKGRVVGPATQHVRAALARSGFSDVRVDLYPWARAYAMALSQPNVLIYLIARTPEREDRFKWAGELMRIQYHLYKLAAREDIVVDSLDAARPYRVGVMRSDVRQHYLQRNGFAQLVESSGNEENFQKLLAGRVDLVPLPRGDVARLCARFEVDCRSVTPVLTLDALTVDLYMAFSLATDDAVVERLRLGYAALKAEGRLVAID
ncbi:substrate-binding periplasmic protein [Denitromonas halophila]|uniref:Transporter substrate-binding domain-containing protein n=1 Tax=Denitromonas halophila TaxID=1629404 RepID=A0A557R0W6_9RHOO|nr:transporter substrate-binding domain-containing protein [Denitromonas halophila]TVO58798.1 transporter substrate-binding domain-containing protein [Denitromonas halophila]